MTLQALRDTMQELLGDFPYDATVSIEREDEDNYLVVRSKDGRKLSVQVVG